jgi:hypothetical protein
LTRIRSVRPIELEQHETKARVGTGNSDNGSNGTATLRLRLPVAGSSDEKHRKLPWQYREIELRPEVGKDNARSK